MRLIADKLTTEILIERFQEPLYWYIRRMVVGHEDAQDVLQDTFIRVHLHLNELKDTSQIRPWLYRIATNEALQWLRRHHEFVSLDTDGASSLIETLRTDEYTDTTDQLLILFQEAVLTLPTMQRTIFNLRYYDELSYKDISEITGSSVGAAKTNYHIAKEKISNYILSHQ